MLISSLILDMKIEDGRLIVGANRIRLSCFANRGTREHAIDLFLTPFGRQDIMQRLLHLNGFFLTVIILILKGLELATAVITYRYLTLILRILNSLILFLGPQIMMPFSLLLLGLLFGDCVWDGLAVDW